MNKNQKQKEPDLSSTGLQMYIYFLKKNPEPRSIGQIKEDLGLPKSTLHYNLERLKKEGLVEETPHGFVAKEFEQLPALKHYISLFGKIFPRYILFSVFFALIMPLTLITEILPELKFLSFILPLIGLIWTLFLVRRYRL